MTVGKTTVGRILAQRLVLPFVDVDQRVEEAAGESVSQVFALRGEAAFRVLEAEAVEQILREPDAVVALGGGTLVQPGLAKRLSSRFPIVVLDLPWEVVQRRLAAVGDRPLSGDAHRLWEMRREAYAAAGCVVDVDGLDPHAAADAVLAALW